MTVVICDDDKNDIMKLAGMMQQYDAKKHVGFSVQVYGSGTELLNGIRDGLQADIIFLDINMDDVDGLTVAKEIREMMEDVPIVLVTAFMNYALDGYKVKASRFLLKDDLENTFVECMDHLCAELLKKSKRIVFRCVEGDVRLKTSEIVLIETSGHKSKIRLMDQTFHIYEKLEDLEEELKGFGFLRIHKSFLVNMAHVRTISSYVLTLDNGRQIPVPKARYRQVRQEYALFVGKEI